jgi:hypothetical protein
MEVFKTQDGHGEFFILGVKTPAPAVWRIRNWPRMRVFERRDLRDSPETDPLGTYSRLLVQVLVESYKSASVT